MYGDWLLNNINNKLNKESLSFRMNKNKNKFNLRRVIIIPKKISKSQ